MEGCLPSIADWEKRRIIEAATDIICKHGENNDEVMTEKNIEEVHVQYQLPKTQTKKDSQALSLYR